MLICFILLFNFIKIFIFYCYCDVMCVVKILVKCFVLDIFFIFVFLYRRNENIILKVDI